MTDLIFELLSPAALKPDLRNARTHPKKQIAQIAASIAATAFANPILVDEDKVIIAGHGRLLAAKSLSLAQVPVIIVPGLSDVQKRALRLADNKIAQGAGWDRDLLRLELKEIEIAGYDVELTGFNMGEIDALRVIDDPYDELVPEPPDRPIARPGDIFIAGLHRVGCGDVRDREFLAKVMGGVLADTAQLDPPFNVNIGRYATGGGRVKHAEFAVASGEMDSAQFRAFLEDCLGACVAVSRHGAVHYVWMDHHHLGELMVAGDAVYDVRLNIAVWVKSNAGMGSLYRSQHELCSIYRVGSAKNRNNVHLGKHGRSRTNVWNYASVSAFGGSRRGELELHPTTKPTRAIADAIMDVTVSGEIVLDGFLGSGTSLIAAEQTKRRGPIAVSRRQPERRLWVSFRRAAKGGKRPLRRCPGNSRFAPIPANLSWLASLQRRTFTQLPSLHASEPASNGRQTCCQPGEISPSSTRDQGLRFNTAPLLATTFA